MATSCHACGAEVRIEGPVGRRATCPGCDADLHVCLNCRHHDESAAHACREPHAEHVVDKEAANACDLFQLGDGASRRRAATPRAARDALAALFGEAPAPSGADDPRDAIEALFRKKP
jgi:hypothetical protein